MSKVLRKYKYVFASGLLGLIAAIAVVRCGSSTTVSYTQIERLARPAINEGLVRVNADLNAFNSIAPSVDLTASPAVLQDATVTLEALYAGVCFTNGALGSAVLTPGGKTCESITPGGILNSNLIGLNSTFLASAAGYASYVAGIFLPDVMRIDTKQASGYGTLCASSTWTGLCGGRLMTDPVMDITYAFLLNGELAPSAVGALRNGTYQTSPFNSGGFNTTGNSQQGHGSFGSTMPFSPIPM